MRMYIPWFLGVKVCWDEVLHMLSQVEFHLQLLGRVLAQLPGFNRFKVRESARVSPMTQEQ